MTVLSDTIKILERSLSLGSRAKEFDASTPLLGSLPELDSMAVVSVITAIEEHFGIVIADDDISADSFGTVGSLAALVESKLVDTAS